ncbi:MAG: NPCBM/NEW2 domain-containing protein [Pirellulales bacterium]
MWNLIALIALALAAPADVTATKLDGTSETGQLESWSGKEIVLATQSGPQTVPTGELLEIKFANPSVQESTGPHVELVDGTRLPLIDYSTSKEQAVLQLVLPPPADPESLTAPVEKVRAVQLQRLEPEAVPQWEEIRGLNLPSDVVVVAKRGGKSLDHLECVVGAITQDEVELTVDDNNMKVPRSKVAGVIYYRSDEPRPAAAVVTGVDGLRIAASDVELRGESLRVTTESGLQLAWPISGLVSVDMSAGKVAFLGDLKPASVKWQPLVGLPAAATRAIQFGQPHYNRSAGGGELALAYRDANPSVTSPEIKTFAKGLALRSRSEVIYRLPAGYNRVLAEAGIDPNDAASGNVHLEVYGDDEQLLEKSIDGSDAPVALDLDIAGVGRLKIVVDYGENLDTGDWLNLCNARIVK